MNTLVVGYNDSEAAQAALVWAAGQARRHRRRTTRDVRRVVDCRMGARRGANQSGSDSARIRAAPK